MVSTVIGELAREVEGGVRYFNEIPYFIAIHDRKCRVVAANGAYRAPTRRRHGGGIEPQPGIPLLHPLAQPCLCGQGNRSIPGNSSNWLKISWLQTTHRLSE
jgi:hypothetical protein